MRYLLSLMVLALAACGSLPVTTDYAEEYNFTGKGSYVWLDTPEQALATKNIEFQSDLSKQRIVDAIDQQMQARGFEKVDVPRGDSLLITYHRGIDDKQKVTGYYGWYQHFGYYPCYHCYHRPGFGYPYFVDDDYWVDEYQQDSLVIDLVDPESKELVWRGSTARRLPTLATPEERRVYITETVTEILSHFPPVRGQ